MLIEQATRTGALLLCQRACRLQPCHCTRGLESGAPRKLAAPMQDCVQRSLQLLRNGGSHLQPLGLPPVNRPCTEHTQRGEAALQVVTVYIVHLSEAPRPGTFNSSHRHA